ncbi:hypothetical protein ACPC54_06775 [Kitasatospora sp. NPDC094028]
MGGGYTVNIADLVRGADRLDEAARGLDATAEILASGLSESGGMIGDDEAGEIFAAVYKPASKEVLNQLACARQYMTLSAVNLHQAARNFQATEDAIVGDLGGAYPNPSGSPGAGMAPGWATSGGYAATPKGADENLPEVVGGTSGVDRWVWGDKYRGNPDKLRKVSKTWQAAHRRTEETLGDAQGALRIIADSLEGEMNQAIAGFFAGFVGEQCYPVKPDSTHSLLANLTSSCRQLDDACDRYAKHIDDSEGNFYRLLDAPWNDPIFGGNGNDRGLKSKVLGDTQIQSLAETAKALVDSRKRILAPPGQTVSPKSSGRE